MLETSSVPTKIKRITSPAPNGAEKGSGLEITWSSGENTSIPSELLRRRCPCATCEEARGGTSHDKPLGGGSAGKGRLQVVQSSFDQETDLKQVWAVGNYALGVLWGDNHSTGIYTFELLRELAQT